MKHGVRAHVAGAALVEALGQPPVCAVHALKGLFFPRHRHARRPSRLMLESTDNKLLREQRLSSSKSYCSVGKYSPTVY